MMKKLLVMLTVLAAVSNALVLELSVDGVTNGADNGQTIDLDAPSGTAMIDIYCSADPVVANWLLAVSGPGSFATLGTVYAASHGGVLYDYTATYPTYDQTIGFMSSTSSVPATVGKWWDDEFHCDGEGTVTISLLDYNTLEVLDTITINQIPEPTVIALLGLGGLFLRRRK